MITPRSGSFHRLANHSGHLAPLLHIHSPHPTHLLLWWSSPLSVCKPVQLCIITNHLSLENHLNLVLIFFFFKVRKLLRSADDKSGLLSFLCKKPGLQPRICEKMPEERKEGVLVPSYENKGNVQSHRIYRVIHLMSHIKCSGN